MAAATTTTTTTAIESPTVVKTTLNYYLDPAKGGESWFAPGTAQSIRRSFDQHPVHIHDMRGKEREFGVDKSGFQLVEHTSREKDFDNEDNVKTIAYPEVEEILKQATGATKVVVFSHIIRRQRWEDAASSVSDASVPDNTPIPVVPARFVHVDQSAAGAQQVLIDNLTETDAQHLSRSRWGIINVWRPIHRPVTKDPLAVCDARSTADHDFVPVPARLPPAGSGTYEHVSQGRGFDTLAAKASVHHKWYYASHMTPNEILLIKCFDSRSDHTARRVPHTAFVDPATAHEDQTRESIECRCLVFWEGQQ